MERILRRTDLRGTVWGGALACLFTFLSIVLWGSSPVWAMRVAEVPNPRVQYGWVSDTIDVLPADMEARIDEKLTALEQETGIEIALVTVESVDAPTPKDFATELFNTWGIGKRESNNGLLILLVRGGRRLEMETGYGLEGPLPDGWLKRMQTEKMVPHFRAERYDLGLEAGVDAVLERLRLSPEELRSQVVAGRGNEEPIDLELGWILAFLLGGAGSSALGVGYWRKRERTCPTCKTMMSMVAEEQDDIYLDSGQLTEERVGSVDYQFYYCDDCGFKRRLVVNKWFSGHSACRRCKYKTLHTKSVVVRAATTSSTGLKRITEHCKHCNYHHIRDVILPRITSSSSSGGGGGGGSFGGGSSGGGGAGSSW